jgi:hypothetical protein
VTHENSGGFDPPQRALDCGHVFRISVETVLDGNHLVSVGLQRGNHLAEARAVGPDAVTENDGRFGAVAELVGIEGGVVSGVFNLESSGVEASDWRPRHDEQYHEV